MVQINKCFLMVVIGLFNLLMTTNGLAVNKSPVRPHACIIGAGISGLGSARYLREQGVDFTVYEATSHIGGTWYFDKRVGTDEYGIPLFTSMYKNLRTNTPRQTMEFAGFPMPEGTPSYPSGTCYYKYLKLFVMKFDLMKNIKIQNLVTLVERIKDGWNVTHKQTNTGDLNTDFCDFVIVSNGHYSTPKWPKLEDMNLFKGKIIHSQDYRDPELYRNRSVLVVGAGASGLDLTTHLVGYASKLIHSHHLAYNEPVFGENYKRKPDIKKFTANGVVFDDDSFEEIDDVIFCTGYNFGHPFLADNVGVTATDKFVLPLYQHIVNIKYPTMLFIGLTRKTITRVLDAQAEYAAALVAGKFELPSQEVMLKSWLTHVYEQQMENRKISDVNLVGDKQDQYFANLTAEAGITRAPPVLTDIRDFNAKIRLDDLLNYRDYDIQITDNNHYQRKYNPRKGETCPIAL